MTCGEISCDLQQELTGYFDAPVVFAHNDLLSGNLMLNDEEGMSLLLNFLGDRTIIFPSSQVLFLILAPYLQTCELTPKLYMLLKCSFVPLYLASGMVGQDKK